jgi:putative ABC transport system permease protein
MAELLFYPRLFVWFSLRNFLNHLGRTLVVILGIALGAAVFTSVRLAVYATVESFSRGMDMIAGSSDLTLVRPGGRVPEALIAPLLQHPAVRAASPLLTTYVRPEGRDEPFLLIGFDPVLDRSLHNWTGSSGTKSFGFDWAAFISKPNTLMLGKNLAQHLHWRPGQQVTLVHSQKTANFSVLEILDSEGLTLVEGGLVALCDIATFQEFTGNIGIVDRIDLLLKPGVTPATVQSLKSLFPPGVVMRLSPDQKQGGLRMIQAYQFSLTFLSGISLLVGMFLVYSLITLNAAVRRRELAMLRSIGASSRLIFHLFMGEGALLGLCGWLLALPISSILVKHLLASVSGTVSLLFVRVRAEHLILSYSELALSFLVTIVVAMLAALQPARQAMRVAPREALDIESEEGIQSHPARKWAVIGLALMALLYPVSRLPSPQSVSVPGYLAALLLFAGFALTAPWLLRRLGRLLSPRIFSLGGQPAFLAARYLTRGGPQTAISVSALITAVALFAALIIMIHSFRSTVVLWVEQSIAGDLYIRPKLADLNLFRDPLTPEVKWTIQNLKTPMVLVPVRRLELRINGHPHAFEAMDYAAYAQRNRFIWMNGDKQEIEAALIAGKGVVVSEVFANSTGLGPGDRYRVRIGGRVLDQPILGVFRDYRTRGGAAYYSLAQYQQQFDDSTWSAVQINFMGPGAALADTMSRVEAALVNCCGDRIEMIEGNNLRHAVLRIFDQTFAITTVLLLIALIVAALGMATALTVRVVQRTRELNTLRAVGGSLAQLRNMLFWEAGLTVIMGQAAGLICGFLLSYLLIYVVNPQSFGWTFLYRVDWPGLLLAIPLISASGLAATLPAVRLALRASPALLFRGEMR